MCLLQNQHASLQKPNDHRGLLPASAELAHKLQEQQWVNVALGERDRLLLVTDSAPKGAFLLEFCGEVRQPALAPCFRRAFRERVGLATPRGR